jgi:adenylate kinase family enzyme
MKVFDKETAPVIPHYRELGRFAEINGLQDVEHVSEAIRSALSGFRKGQSK